MIDTQDVIADSSPAQDAPADSSAAPVTAEQPSYRSLEQLSPKERQHWRETGEHPDDKKTEPEDSSTSSETEKPSEPAPASQPAPQERKARNSSENRVKELLEQQKNRDTEIASLRSEIERLTKSPKADAPAVPSTAPKAEAKKFEQLTSTDPNDPKPDAKLGPDGQPWKSWNEYQEAKDAWLIREGERRAQANVQKTERDRQAAELNKKIEESWKTRVDGTIKKLGVKPEDFAKVAFSKDLPINKATDGFILDSQHGAELLYHLGQNPELAKEVAKLDPIATIRLLTRLEMALSGETSAPPPKTTRTPPPPTDLGARQTAPKDEAEAAAARGDFATYKKIMNQRDLEAARNR